MCVCKFKARAFLETHTIEFHLDWLANYDSELFIIRFSNSLGFDELWRKPNNSTINQKRSIYKR